MKKLVVILMGIFLISMLFFGCNGQQIPTVQPCIVEKPDGKQIEFKTYCDEIKNSGRTSYICNLLFSYDFDACYLHRGMEIASKEGLILEGYTYEEFEKWANYVKVRIQAGLTYESLKDIILLQFSKINKIAGSQILILGDMFLQLPQDKIIPEDDVVLVISSIDDLVKEVKNLNIWIK